MDFSQSPLLVIWEVTQSCDLACAYCRASAMPSRHPDELTTAEGYKLIDRVREFGNPLMVFTGGDPLKLQTFTTSSATVQPSACGPISPPAQLRC